MVSFNLRVCTRMDPCTLIFSIFNFSSCIMSRSLTYELLYPSGLNHILRRGLPYLTSSSAFNTLKVTCENTLWRLNYGFDFNSFVLEASLVKHLCHLREHRLVFVMLNGNMYNSEQSRLTKTSTSGSASRFSILTILVPPGCCSLVPDFIFELRFLPV